ncbi:MAG: NADPH-dependent 7-cyano-7-deazaguanine reductase QueF [Nitrospinae bacterium]|nr:NADPH-dependent 7-cyano-7-deazaguanine reductase QueF [Nitrospinota bacterium]
MSDLTMLGNKTEAAGSPEKAIIEAFDNKYKRPYLITFEAFEFTSMCPVTHQPDFATITISYVPKEKCAESKSLKLYLQSFRNVGMFHEEIVNKILDDFVRFVEPQEVTVKGDMNPRGGISIAVEASWVNE